MIIIPLPFLLKQVSYGEPESQVANATRDRVHLEFAKLGLRGVTIISTSGDMGASDGDSATLPTCTPRRLHFVRRGGASAITRNFLSILQTVRSDKIFYEQISVSHIDFATFRPTTEALRTSTCYLIGILEHTNHGGVQDRHDCHQ